MKKTGTIVIVALIAIIAGLVIFKRESNRSEVVMPVVMPAIKPSAAKTVGTCAPNTVACNGNAVLCMEENRNSVCNDN